MARKPKKPPTTPLAHVIPAHEILRKLFVLGYFGDTEWVKVKKISGDDMTQAVKAYQLFNGLEPTGTVGPKTAHRIARRRCGLPDFNLTTPGHVCKWPMEQVSYYQEIHLPGMPDDAVAEAYSIAFSQWAAVCNLDPQAVDSPSKANIYARSGTGKKHGLDDRGGTLAWSELPCGVAFNVQLDQMFDEAEAWSFNMAVAVMCHELGHALGLPHLNDGNLMAPYYDPKVTAPQKGDIVEIVKLYGKRSKKYPINKDAGLKIGGTIMINGRPYVLVPQT